MMIELPFGGQIVGPVLSVLGKLARPAQRWNTDFSADGIVCHKHVAAQRRAC
jgi:hypothetical protein